MKKAIFLLIVIVYLSLIYDKAYAYKEYKVGDIVPYNGIDFYVIKDSSEDEDTVTLLKAEPLTVDEVNLYGGVGSENNHVNMYILDSSSSYYQQANNQNGYGGITYYTSKLCGCYSNHCTYNDCKIDYAMSEVKYVVDAWAKDKFDAKSIKEARLIKYEELTEYLGYNESLKRCTGGCWYEKSDDIPSWVYNENYSYWTMSPVDDSSNSVWYIKNDGIIDRLVPYFSNDCRTIRPVITLNKNALEKKDESINENDNDIKISDNNKKESISNVKVPNTLRVISIVLTLVGIVLVSISIVIIAKNNKKVK